MSKKRGIPITNWNSPAKVGDTGDAQGEEPFDDGGFEEYWEKMELLDLDETEIPLDQLECGSDRGDFGDSINSYLKDMSPLRGDGPGDVSQFEGNDYSALLQEVTNHLQRESQENENGIEDYGDEDYEDEDYEDEDYGDEGGEYGGAEPGPDEDDDMFAEYEEDMRNSKAERALSRGPEGSDNVRLEASHENYSSDGEDDDGIAVVAAHNGHSLRSPTGDAAADESYVDDYEDEDDCEIDYAASPVRSGGHVHAGYGIAATGALAGSIGGTGLFSPTKIKHLLDKEADEDENDESPEAKNAQWSSHSRSKTIDRSKFNPEPGQPDSRGAEVVFSASSYGAEGYGDDGANPVFTYKDFEFLPSAEEETGRLQRAQLKEIRRRQQQQQALPRGGRKIVINQGPSAPPKIKKAGPYAQEKLGAPPGVQRKKKGQPVDPAQARKQRENREKHKLMLEMIALKRKEQEDEAIRQVLREEAKRKRFKEALLEKALSKRVESAVREEDMDSPPSKPSSSKKERPMRDRDGSARRQRSTRLVDANQSPEDIPLVKPSLLEPTKAFEAQMMPARKRGEEVVDEEERMKQEEDKYEKVAEMRRKFKEQHKQILLNMLIKKRELDQKREESEKLEAHRALIKKMKRDERLARRAAESEDRTEVPRADLPAEEPAAIPRKTRRRPEAAAFVTDDPVLEGNVGSFGDITSSTRGGVPLMRSRSQGESKEDLNAQSTEPQSIPRRRRQVTEASGDKPVDEAGRRAKSAIVSKESTEDIKPNRIRRVRTRSAADDAQSAHEREQPLDSDLQRNLEALDEITEDLSAKRKDKRAAALSAKDKIDAQLAAIALQRRQAAEEEKKNEERMRRRVEKLAKRIVQEAHESKRDIGDEAAADEAESIKPRPKKVTPEMAEAMVSRLQAKVQKTADGIAMLSTASVPARDFADWKRKHNVSAEGQVFSMTGWYPCVKEALLSRGWFFNPDPLSPYFDLKWTLRSSDIGLESLQSWQLTNHFLKNIAITTKAGLIKSLQQLVWQADIPPSDIIPRAYDLTNVSELHAFVTDFRLQKAEGLLKGVYAKITGSHGKLSRPDRPRTAPVPQVSDGSDDGKDMPIAHTQSGICDAPRPFTARVLYETAVPLPPCAGISADQLMVNKAVFEACCSALERYLRPEDDSYIDTREEDDDDIPMTPLEWELLTHHDLYTASKAGLPDIPPELLGPFGRDVAGDDSAADDPSKAQKFQAAQHRNKRKQRKNDSFHRSKAESSVAELMPVGQEGFQRVHNILYRLQALSANQSGLNGSGEESKNIWIVKPAAKSRGRGICTFVDLDKLLQYCDVAQKGQGSGSGGATMWIVQKYMENPLVIKSHKFDLRQWVLVTDWNPLTIYFFDEAYCRFSSEEYSTSEESLENAFVHLVNQSVNKNNLDKKGQTFKAENDEEVSGFMWSCAQFQKYLAFKNNGVDVWTQKVQPRMKEIAKMTLACAVDMIEHRKNSWELYGFDYMIDDEYNAWLIEVNSSPACDYSTPTTERYVQKALVELLSVTLDVRKWEAAPRKERGERPGTGGWECIYKGPMLETPASSFGTDMTVKGAGMKVPRRAPPVGATGVNVYTPNGLEREGSVSFNDSVTTKAIPAKGVVGGRLGSSRRQSAGLENAPNSVRQQRLGSGLCNSDDDAFDDDVMDSNATVRGTRVGKASYDPLSLARNSSFGSSKATPSKASQPGSKQSPGAEDFDDSSGDEVAVDKHTVGFANNKKQANNAANHVKHMDHPVGAVAIPVKVFTVDF